MKRTVIFNKDSFSMIEENKLHELLKFKEVIEVKDLPLCSRCFQKQLEDMKKNLTMYLNLLRTYVQENQININTIIKVYYTEDNYLIVELSNQGKKICLDQKGNLVSLDV